MRGNTVLALSALLLAPPLCKTKLSYIERTLLEILLAEWGKLGSCSACSIAFFAEFTCNSQWSKQFCCMLPYDYMSERV